jgi:hypothetical protein
MDQTEELAALKNRIWELEAALIEEKHTRSIVEGSHNKMYDELVFAESITREREAQLAEARKLLEWLDNQGGLGYEKHDHIRALLARKAVESDK